MKGKKIKQVNNLVIYYSKVYNNFAVWHNNICYEEFNTLEKAEEFCKKTKDFLRKEKELKR